MPGWNLKSGLIQKMDVSDDEYWSMLNFVFSDACRKTNTYKFGLIKSICDQIYDLQLDAVSSCYFLTYERLFSKFTENYWNLVNKYELRQMSYNGKSEYSKIEQILKTAATGFDIPEEVAFTSLPDVTRKHIVKVVTTECKKCVIGALYNDFEGKFYSFDLRGDGLFFSSSSYGFISKYKMEIERLNYYSWARFLEKINDDRTLVRVLEKLDLATPQRRDLSIYREVLYKEFQEDRCFYCGRKLERSIHVDHFIPWRFVKDDNLWNFVLACPACNLRKKDSLADRIFLSRVEQRNNRLLQSSGIDKTFAEFIQREFTSYREGLLSRMWEYARMSGVRERDMIDH